MEELSPNSTLSHYRIVSKIGAGGMGEVYLAQDTKLDRKVALKILPSDFGADEGRMGRFIREAKSVSALNHPNILTIHEIGEDSNQHYISTEFIAGETLRRRIDRGPLPIAESIEIACQIGAALNAAHQASIVHRDIKPENVMIRADGLVKVLDFGLAKLTGGTSSDPESETRIQSDTQPGIIMGTVAYMSPQQARGKPVDSRTDVWSLGVVIYEMLSGRQPFRGETVTDTLANILHRNPEPLNIDSHLVQIVWKMLGKNLETRYATVDEVVIDLNRLKRQIEFETELERKSPATTKTEAQTVVIPSTTIPSQFSGAPIDSGAARADEGFWIAVLPFKFRGSNPDLEVLAEGLSEDIVTGLSRFSYLRVIARGSTLRFTSEGLDIRTIGKELGARYVMEGSLRLAGSMLRLSVQLVDSSSGSHIWAETYDRTFKSDDIFALQDDLVPLIVSTVADQHGVLVHSIGEALRKKSDAQLSPNEAVLRVFGFHERMTPVEHGQLRDVLERVVRDSPDQGDAWAMLATLYSDEYMFGFNLKADPIGRAHSAALLSVEHAPSSNLASQALAQALFFRREMIAFRPTAERTIALNRMDAPTLAFMGLLIACSGDWDHGCAVADSAMQLNPHFPGWYRLASVFNAYRLREYNKALEGVLRINIPGYFMTLLVSAAAYGQLNQVPSARKQLQELLNGRPDFATTAREELAKWFDDELVDHFLEGLHKAGLNVTEVKSQSAIVPAVENSSRSGSLTQSVAVLPLQNLSGDTEQEYFADGITEEILNALAQIPGLRVAGRSSAFSFKGKNEDLRSVGAKLNVANILEGTLRRSGDRLRITAQLIDVSSGYQLWSERYDRVIEDVFTVQDEIATTIAGRLQLSLSVESEVQQQQPATRHIGAYELYLKGRALLYQRGLSIPKAIDCFTEAVALDPSYAQAWAGLADGYTTYGYSGFKPAIEVMPLALDAARRALELDENLAEAHNAFACPTLLYERDYSLAKREFIRALELNPNYSQARGWYGLFCLQWVEGDDAKADVELSRMLQIDPLSSYANVMYSFFCTSSNRSTEVVEPARRGVELDPHSYLAQWSLAVALEYAGQFEEAATVAERALAMSGRHTWALTTLASIYGAWNKPDDARAVYRELEVRRTREYIQPSMMAIAAAAVDEMDRAIELAQEALDDRDPLFVMVARTWPQNKKLRANKRFREIVSDLSFPNWNVEVG